MIRGIALQQQIEARQVEVRNDRLTVVQPKKTEPLQDCVRNALRSYLRSLDGHEVNDLHQMVMGEVERPLIETVLEYTNGNQTQTARLLGVSRGTLRKKMAQYKLR